MSDTSTNDSSSITDSVTDGIVQSLAECFSTSSYACGGTVKINLPKDTPSSKNAETASNAQEPMARDQALAEPVTIHWDSTTTIEKLILPLPVPGELSSVEKLVAGTHPASFGFQGQDVIDESYRKASKLDTSAFSTNFCPYEVGIIDVISQILLQKLPYSFQGIRAELYKLNIYQAPSGLFKPHVDTPRSDLQIGSLVVCLPCEHQGGQLVVRHQGHTTMFDWSGSVNEVKWAAFYSDCEHEVLEVTSGHRITLTYNLYVRRGLGEIAGYSETLDAQQLPVYNEIKGALAKPDFMPEGGTLGRYCSHAYAHATKYAASTLPSTLKGSDMVAYEVFRSLGIKVIARPVVEDISQLEYRDDAEGDFRTHNHIGNQFTEPINTGRECSDYCSMREVYKAYPNTLMKVTWMNGPTSGTENPQFTFARYGNQAEADFAYSYCALLFEIPSYPKRVKIAKKRAYSP